MSREIPLAFVLETEARSGHPHAEYTHVCDVTLFGREMWSRWGRSAEEAERSAEFEIASRVASALRGFTLRPHSGSPSGKERRRMSARVAALYVDPAGVYAGLEDVDLWDEARDARLYGGPWPVVAHPPCKSWSLMGQCRPLTVAAGDGGTFQAALEAVEKYGGVLEHPAHTRAWRTFNLPKPATNGWNIALHGRHGWATEIDQAAYGHPCHKRTWLYYVGDAPPPKLDWRFIDTGRKVRDDGGGGRDQRSRTPLAFRDVLLAMARTAQVAAGVSGAD